jgi:hypothetical protein
MDTALANLLRDSLPHLIDAAVRGTIVLLAALALTTFMRRGSAAARHGVWAGAHARVRCDDHARRRTPERAIQLAGVSTLAARHRLAVRRRRRHQRASPRRPAEVFLVKAAN